MRKPFVVLACFALLSVAARPAPAGEFFISPGLHLEGGTVTFTFGSGTHMNHNDEVTLGVWCALPDGSPVLWDTRLGVRALYEFNSFGGFGDWEAVLSLPVYGTGYNCTARYVEVDWFKGVPLQAWTLDEEPFEVVAA